MGTSVPVIISTASYSKPARFDLLVAGKTSSAQLKLKEDNVTIARGDYQGEMVLQAETGLVPGVYFVYWTVSGDEYPLLYETLPVLRVDVVPALVPITLQLVPELKANATSFPLWVRLPCSPATNLTVTLSSVESNVTLSPEQLSFLPGTTEASYTITTSESANVWGSVSFAVSGPDAATYWLPQSSLGFSISPRDESEPSILLTKQDDLLQPHSGKLRVSVDRVAQLFWVLQEAGLAAPSAEDLVKNGQWVMVDPERMETDLEFEGLTASSLYDWYGVLQSENGVTSAVRKNTIRTCPKVNPVQFVVELQGPTPSDVFLATEVQQWTATVLGVPECSVTIIGVSVDDPVEGTHQVTIRLDGQDTDVHQSPKETILSLSSAEYLADALSSYTVSSFASSWTELSTSAPRWSEPPHLFNGNSSMVQVILAPGVDGFIYVSVYEKNATFPNAKDVKWGRTRTREKALYSAWQQAFAGQVAVVSLSDLPPSSDFVVYAVLQNSRTDSEELTGPFPLTVPQTIFSYLNEVSEINTATLIAVLLPALALSLI